MKRLLISLTLLTFQLISHPVVAASSPSFEQKKKVNIKVSKLFCLNKPVPAITSLTWSLLKHRKLTFKEKLVMRLLQWKQKLQTGGIDQPTEKQKKWGKLSFILAVAAALVLLVPYAAVAVGGAVGILILPLAITSLVFGIKSIEGNTNTLGLIGVILSSTLLLFILLAIVVLLIIFSQGFF